MAERKPVSKVSKGQNQNRQRRSGKRPSEQKSRKNSKVEDLDEEPVQDENLEKEEVPRTEHKKYGKEHRKKRRWWLIPFIIFDTLLVLLILAVVIGSLLFKRTYGISIQECREEAAEIVEESSPDDFTFSRASVIYDASGDKMLSVSEGDASNYLSYAQIPEDVVNAFVSVEDRSFWTNRGISIKGTGRAVIGMITGDSSSGGSTITQQLCKLKFLTNEKSILRKVKEMFLAWDMSKTYSKEQIMEWYVNNCCFANGIYGIGDAAKAYFDKDVSELSLAECVYLCSIPNWPEHYDPWKNPEEALGRSQRILNAMLECGYITQEEFEEAASTELTITSGKEETNYDYAASYAIHCAVEVLMNRDGFEFQNVFDTTEEYQEYQDEYDEAYGSARHKLATEGYSVYTSIDKKTQKKTQGFLDDGLSGFTDVNDEGIYLLQGSVTVINNETGKVEAVIGGRSQDDLNAALGYNRAYQFKRQPGSAIKPLNVYLPALEKGYTAASQIKDIDVQEAYAAYQNNENVMELDGESFSLRYAVEKSLNGAALYVYSDITPEVGMSCLTDLGFRNLVPDDYYLSGALGGFTYGTNTVEMANAYSAVARYGSYVPANCILSMEDVNGMEIYHDEEAVQVYREEDCVSMTDIMTGVLTYGTANETDWYVYSSEPVAGKTGTTNNSADGWFVGYSADYTIAVWVGRDDNTGTEDLEGGTYPAQIWKESMLWLTENRDLKQESSIFDEIGEREEEEIPEEEEEEEEEEIPDGEYEIWHLNTDASIRDAPTTNSNVLFALRAGTDVTVVDRQTNWTQILVDGQTCYVYSPFLSEGSAQRH